MEHPKDIGDRSTLAVLLMLASAGYPVLVPFGENTRYDLVIDEGSRLARVQVKTGRLRLGGVRFAVCSAYGHHRDPANARRSYHGQVDYFAVFCPETCGVYLIPIEDIKVNVHCTLRVTPARNNQHAGVRLAANYEIGRVSVETLATGEVSGSAGVR
jgi:hypothetical protein